MKREMGGKYLVGYTICANVCQIINEFENNVFLRFCIEIRLNKIEPEKKDDNYICRKIFQVSAELKENLIRRKRGREE